MGTQGWNHAAVNSAGLAPATELPQHHASYLTADHLLEPVLLEPVPPLPGQFSAASALVTQLTTWSHSNCAGAREGSGRASETQEEGINWSCVSNTLQTYDEPNCPLELRWWPQKYQFTSKPVSFSNTMAPNHRITVRSSKPYRLFTVVLFHLQRVGATHFLWHSTLRFCDDLWGPFQSQPPCMLLTRYKYSCTAWNKNSFWATPSSSYGQQLICSQKHWGRASRHWNVSWLLWLPSAPSDWEWGAFSSPQIGYCFAYELLQLFYELHETVSTNAFCGMKLQSLTTQLEEALSFKDQFNSMPPMHQTDNEYLFKQAFLHIHMILEWLFISLSLPKASFNHSGYKYLRWPESITYRLEGIHELQFPTVVTFKSITAFTV